MIAPVPHTMRHWIEKLCKTLPTRIPRPECADFLRVEFGPKFFDENPAGRSCSSLAMTVAVEPSPGFTIRFTSHVPETAPFTLQNRRFDLTAPEHFARRLDYFMSSPAAAKGKFGLGELPDEPGLAIYATENFRAVERFPGVEGIETSYTFAAMTNGRPEPFVTAGEGKSFAGFVAALQGAMLHAWRDRNVAGRENLYGVELTLRHDTTGVALRSSDGTRAYMADHSASTGEGGSSPMIVPLPQAKVITKLLKDFTTIAKGASLMIRRARARASRHGGALAGSEATSKGREEYLDVVQFVAKSNEFQLELIVPVNLDLVLPYIDELILPDRAFQALDADESLKNAYEMTLSGVSRAELLDAARSFARKLDPLAIIGLEVLTAGQKSGALADFRLYFLDRKGVEDPKFLKSEPIPAIFLGSRIQTTLISFAARPFVEALEVMGGTHVAIALSPGREYLSPVLICDSGVTAGGGMRKCVTLAPVRTRMPSRAWQAPGSRRD